MASVIDALGNGLFAGTVPVDSIVKNNEKIALGAREEIQDKVDFSNTKLAEIAKLQLALTSVKTAVAALADPLQKGFTTKKSLVSTQEAGLSGSDFLANVRVDTNAINGATNIAVERVATHSDLIIRSNAGAGFAADGDINVDGTLTLTVGGQARIIAVADGQTLDDVINNINSAFLAADDAFEAFKLQGPGDTAYIEVRAKNTGAANTIAFLYADSGNVPGAAELANNPVVPGVDAIIYVNGVQNTQATNKFENVVPGLSFEAVRANTANGANATYGNLNYNTIQVSEDQSAVKKLIIDFGNSLNEVSYLATKNSKSSASLDAFKFADPFSNKISFDDPDAPLKGASFFGQVESLFTTLTTEKIGATGDIKSIYDLGMAIKEEVKDGVSHQVIYFADQEKFQTKFENNYNDVYNFFVTNAKITPTVGNAGYVQYIPIDSARPITDESIIGKDINLAVTYDGGHAVTNVVATVNGAPVNGTIEHNASSGRYDISFAGTKLEGILLSIDPGAANGIETSTINYQPGLSNIIRQDVRELVSDDGLSGFTVDDANLIQDQIQSNVDEMERIQGDLDKFSAEMEQLRSTLEFMETQTNLLLASLDAILGDS